ncbi:MAG: hypothetical protein ACI4SP_03120 [Eubacteriales bacterium]
MEKQFYKEQARRRSAESEAAALRTRLQKAESLLARYALSNGDDPAAIVAQIDDFPLPADPERWKDALMFYMMDWLNRAPHSRAQWEDFAGMMAETFGEYGVTREDILKFMGRR